MAGHSKPAGISGKYAGGVQTAKPLKHVPHVPETERPHDFHQLFEREIACCRGQLYEPAPRVTGNYYDAEDLAQETLTRAYCGLRSFTPGTNARAWLYRILVNTFVNTRRKRQREPAQVLKDFSGLGDMQQCRCSTAPSAKAEALARLGDGDMMRAVDELPEFFRASIYLADIQGYPCREVAGLLGIPPGTVMSRLHRGRSRLRQRLAAYA